jgi:hypothetical protein
MSNVTSSGNMKLALALLLSLSVMGCAVPRAQQPPMSVRVMPNDCANRGAIINWLTQQAAVPRAPMESQQSYDQTQRQIRYRIWTIRYNCQPA